MLHLPAGRITEDEVKQQIAVLLGGGIGVAYLLDTWVGHDFPTLTVSTQLLLTSLAAL
jgi:chlorophyll synthase